LIAAALASRFAVDVARDCMKATLPSFCSATRFTLAD
jgi:hypothetical protein